MKAFVFCFQFIDKFIVSLAHPDNCTSPLQYKIDLFFEIKLQMSKPSKVHTSTADVKFNSLSESSDSQDLSVSSFSTDKMSQNASSGKKYVSTATYLQQIEEKYNKIDKKRENKVQKNYRVQSVQSSQFMLQKDDNQSHVSNYNHHDVPEKFKRPIPQVNQPPPQSAQPKPNVIESRIISNISQPPQQPPTVQVMPPSDSKPPVMEMHIPEDLSLSRGISERGVGLAYKSSLVDDKSKFFQLCTKVKQSLPQNHPGQSVLIAQMFQETQQQNVPQAQWEVWVRKRLNA